MSYMNLEGIQFTYEKIEQLKYSLSEKYLMISSRYYLPARTAKTISHSYLNLYFDHPIKVLQCLNNKVCYQRFQSLPERNLVFAALKNYADNKNLILGFDENNMPDLE